MGVRARGGVRLGLTEGGARKGPRQQARKSHGATLTAIPLELATGLVISDHTLSESKHRYVSGVLQEPRTCRREARCPLLEENTESSEAPAGDEASRTLVESVRHRKLLAYGLLGLPCRAGYWDAPRRPWTDRGSLLCSVMASVLLLWRTESLFLGPQAAPCCPPVPHFPTFPPQRDYRWLKLQISELGNKAEPTGPETPRQVGGCLSLLWVIANHHVEGNRTFLPGI